MKFTANGKSTGIPLNIFDKGFTIFGKMKSSVYGTFKIHKYET